MGNYAEAIAAYDLAINLENDHTDAISNKEIVEQLLEQQESEEGEEQDGDSQENQSEQNSDNESEQNQENSDQQDQESQEGNQDQPPGGRVLEGRHGAESKRVVFGTVEHDACQ